MTTSPPWLQEFSPQDTAYSGNKLTQKDNADSGEQPVVLRWCFTLSAASAGGAFSTSQASRLADSTHLSGSPQLFVFFPRLLTLLPSPQQSDSNSCIEF